MRQTLEPYVALLRGINVGGKNPVPMAALRACLTELGFVDVSTYIASGNVILRSDRTAEEISALIEKTLPAAFTLHDERVRVLTLSRERLRAVIEGKPPGFGERPEVFHSDAIFLIDVDADQVMPVFNPREGVDMVWQGDGVVYSQRVTALRTKSRLGVIAASPLYKSMTIRNWRTTRKLWELVEATGGTGAVT